MKITLELNGTLELAALESALEMFEQWALETIQDPKTLSKARERLEANAGIALLKRVRGE